MTEYWAPPRLWPGATVACLAGGPSLDLAQVRRVGMARAEGRIRAIAVNDAVYLAWWADVLYACDARWWVKHRGAAGFPGLKVAMEGGSQRVDAAGVHVVRNSGTEGIETDPKKGLRTGRNGGHQALNLAVQLGAGRILLLAYDMKPDAGGRSHWFGEHDGWETRDSIMDKWARHLDALAPQMADLGVEVVNCTPGSAVTAFPSARLEDVLS